MVLPVDPNDTIWVDDASRYLKAFQVEFTSIQVRVRHVPSTPTAQTWRAVAPYVAVDIERYEWTGCLPS